MSVELQLQQVGPECCCLAQLHEHCVCEAKQCRDLSFVYCGSMKASLTAGRRRANVATSCLTRLVIDLFVLAPSDVEGSMWAPDLILCIYFIYSIHLFILFYLIHLLYLLYFI